MSGVVETVHFLLIYIYIYIFRYGRLAPTLEPTSGEVPSTADIERPGDCCTAAAAVVYGCKVVTLLLYHLLMESVAYRPQRAAIKDHCCESVSDMTRGRVQLAVKPPIVRV